MNVPFSQLSTLARRPLADQLPLSGPLAVWIESVSACNFACSFCPQSLPEFKAMKSMDRPTYDRVLTELAGFGTVKVLRLYGTGEPTLAKDIAERVSAVRRIESLARVRTEIKTNGSHIERLIDCTDLDYLVISLYATGADEQAQFTGSTITPDEIRDNLRAVRRARDARGGGPPGITINSYAADFRAARQLFDGIADEVWDARQILHEWTDPGVLGAAPTCGTTVKHRHVCASPFYLLHIWADGTVSPCCVDWKKAVPLGNIHKTSLADIWNGEPLRELRLAHLSGRRREYAACATCTYSRIFPDDLDAVPKTLYQIGKPFSR